MNEQIQAIRGWVQNAVECETKKAITQLHNKHFMTDYERGRVHGAISAYQHVLVETSPTSAWKVPYNAFNTWVADICEHTPLTAGDAIEIYNFCDRNDLLKRYNIVERVIELGLQGHKRYDITNLLKLEALKEIQRIKLRWRRHKNDE